jgi:glycosyltransferase involved in cell wall biosynthesis
VSTILHVAQPTIGGVPQMVCDLVAGQHRAGDRVVVACPTDGLLAGRAEEAGAEVVVWEAERSPARGLGPEIRALRHIVGEVQPDVVHLHSSKAGLVGRLAVRGRIPTVFQPQAWSFSAVTGPLRIASARWERHGARWAHRIVCVNEMERDEGVRAGVRGRSVRYSIVPNGIDTAAFLDVPPAEPDPERPTVVCVGRLCRQKGQDVLLAAWPAVLARVPAARLVLVGGGPDAGALRAQAGALGLGTAVEFVGDVPVAKPWYQLSDVMVMPSRWEGMALAPLEAMASGRAVVITDVPGARETLPKSDRGALAPVPVDDPVALASVVVEMLLDHGLRSEAASAGRVHVSANYDISGVVDRIYDVYREAEQSVVRDGSVDIQ